MNYYELLKKFRKQKDKIEKLEKENALLKQNSDKFINIMKLYQLNKLKIKKD